MAHKMVKAHSIAHPGFNKVQHQIARHITPRPGETRQEVAAKILASQTRKASPAARRANPRLKRVKGY